MLHASLSLSSLKLNFLNHAINNVSLADVLFSRSLEIFHDTDNHNGELAELIERDLHLLGCISVINLLVLLGILHIKVLSATSLLPLNLSLTVDIFLDVRKFNITFDNVDVRVTHEAAHFSNIVSLDLMVTVGTSHTFTQTNKTFKLAHSNLVGRATLAILLILSHSLELFLEHMSRLLIESGLDSSCEFDICLQLFC
jgi:hypothetical protein